MSARGAAVAIAPAATAPGILIVSEVAASAFLAVRLIRGARDAPRPCRVPVAFRAGAFMGAKQVADPITASAEQAVMTLILKMTGGLLALNHG